MLDCDDAFQTKQINQMDCIKTLTDFTMGAIEAVRAIALKSTDFLQASAVILTWKALAFVSI